MLVLVTAAVGLAWIPDSPLVPRDAGLADQGTAWLFLVLLVAAFAAYLLGLRALRRDGVAVRAVVVLALAVQLVPLGAPLLLSTDAWTYWEYGWIANHGGNPYVDTPSEFPDNPAFDYAGADWRDETSVYGPAFTIASQPVAAAAGGSADAAAWLFKGLAAAAMAAAALVVARLAAAPAFAAAFVGWNPLLAVHVAGGGHNDAWIAIGAVGALALAIAGRRQLAGGLWALAILVKWVPAVFFVLAALEARAQRRALGLVGCVAAGVLVAVLASLQWGLDWLRAFGPLARNAAGETSYALPHRLEQAGVPDAVALTLAVAVLVAGLAWLARDARRGRARYAPAAVLLLVTTPWLAVWYLAWAVPLAALEERRWQLATLALCAYLLPQTIPL